MLRIEALIVACATNISLAAAWLRYGEHNDEQIRMHWIDPESLSESKHRIRQFLVNQDGDVDGFVSTDGAQVHVPPHLGEVLTAAVTAGDMVYVRGVRPRGADVLVAVSIESAHGHRIEDNEVPAKRPRKKRPPFQSREMEGICERVLYAPRGERVGVLFTNGVTVRFDPEVADELDEFLQPGVLTVVSGNLCTTPWGSVLDAEYFWHPEASEVPQSG
jgi:hypothetical protein